MIPNGSVLVCGAGSWRGIMPLSGNLDIYVAKRDIKKGEVVYLGLDIVRDVEKSKQLAESTREMFEKTNGRMRVFVSRGFGHFDEPPEDEKKFGEWLLKHEEE
jgi:hypothetical protein